VIYWGHGGGSAVVIGVLLVTFVLWATAGRRRPAGGGQRSGAGFLAPPGRRGPSQGPFTDPGPSVPGAAGPDPSAGGPGTGSATDAPSRRPGFTGIAAGWLPDPSGRYERRYWSGQAWTDHVTSDGVPGSDPPPGGLGRDAG
jgi:Protein of unknown function (DUF2510)